MKRLMTVLAMTALASACGDDESEKRSVADAGSTSDAGPSAVDAASRSDAAQSVGDTAASDDAGGRGVDGGRGSADASTSTGARVATAGLACTSATAASACGGTSPVCLERIVDVPTAALTPGGYCSAACTVDAECGPQGICPTGEALALFSTIPLVTQNLGRQGYCHQECTPGQAGGCRAGYVCASLADLFAMTGAERPTGFAFLDKALCYPAATLPQGDAGSASSAGDAGSAKDAGADAAP